MYRRNHSNCSQSPAQSIFPIAPVSRLRLCFETTADGRIPIVNDFDYVMRCLAMYPSIYVQAEHVYGRLSMLIPRADVIRNFTTPIDLSPQTDGSKMKPIQAHEIWATLEKCKCCGSPGQISFFNQFGGRFLQVSASRDMEPRDWAQFLAQVAVDPNAKIQPHNDSEAVQSVHPSEPNGTEPFPLSKMGLIKMLEQMAISEAAFEFTLPTSQFSLSQSFCIHQIYEEDGHLTFQGNDVGCTLSLKAMQGFSLKCEDDVHTLYCLGVEKKILFQISVPDSYESPEVWHRILDGAKNVYS